MKIPNQYMDRRSDGETVLRQCQLVQLHLLHIVDAICKENNIEYCLMSGTLIGALRHNGFIPWDDDLDLWMTSKNYKKFAQIAPQCLPDDALLQTPEETPGTAICFMKVRDKRSFYFEPRSDIMADEPSGIYIDIFKLERLPAINLTVWKYLVKCCASPWQRKIYFLNQARKGIRTALWAVPSAIFCSLIHKFIRAFIDLYRSLCPGSYHASNFEGVFQRVYKNEDLFPFKTHTFEDGDFPVPNNADAILTTVYGNWREIPPVEKRPRHAKIIYPFHSAT